MTFAQRAWLGACLGALLVILLHPAAGPWIRYGLWDRGPSAFLADSPVLAENLATLPDPTGPKEAALWVQTGAGRIRSGEALSTDEKLLLAEVCLSAGTQEPNNAFWPQGEALFQAALGNDEAARRAWERASRCSLYNDHQTPKVRDVLTGLRAESGSEMGWHGYAAREVRQSAAAHETYMLGRALLGQSATLEDRITAFRNGILLRDGAKSVGNGWHGLQLAEAAAIGPTTIRDSRRTETRQRLSFITELADSGRAAEASLARNRLAQSEAWMALASPPIAEKRLRRLVAGSLLPPILPGALLLLAVASGFLGLAAALSLKHKEKVVPPAAWTTIFAVVLGVVVFGLTQEVAAALWLTLTVAALGIPLRPAVPGTAKKFTLSWTIGTTFLLIGCCIAVLSVLTTRSLPASVIQTALPQMESQWRVGTQPALLCFVIGLTLAWIHVYAYLQRRHPWTLLLQALQQFAQRVSPLLVVACAVSIALCVRWDLEIRTELQNIALNEPAYYLTQR